MAEEKDLDQASSEELLKTDLGKSIYDIFTMLEGLTIDMDSVSVMDVNFYRDRVAEARGHSSKVRREINLVLRAKTRAQSRLTSRQTRWQITMDQKLVNDATVLAGTSIDDRKARAANDMTILKVAISESKNEVEALKNLKQALDVTLRDFNAQCSDFKEQAKLVAEEGSRYRTLPENGMEQDSAHSDAIKAIEDEYGLTDAAVTAPEPKVAPSENDPITLGDEVVPPLVTAKDPTDVLMDSMMEGFQVDTSGLGIEEAIGGMPDLSVKEPQGFTLPGETETEEEPEPVEPGTDGGLSLPEEVEATAPSEQGYTLPGDDEPTVEEPTVGEPTVEEPTVEEPTVEEPTVEEPTVEEPAVEEPAVEEPAVEEPAVEEPAVEDDEDTISDDFDPIADLLFLDDVDEIEQETTGTVTEALADGTVTVEVTEGTETGVEEPKVVEEVTAGTETSVDEPVATEDSAEEYSISLEDTVVDAAAPEFSVAEVVTTEAKVSKHFAVEPEAEIEMTVTDPSGVDVTEEMPSEESAEPAKPTPTKSAVADLDDLLGELGVG